MFIEVALNLTKYFSLTVILAAFVFDWDDYEIDLDGCGLDLDVYGVDSGGWWC
jgi:hypothetical protein